MTPLIFLFMIAAAPHAGSTRGWIAHPVERPYGEFVAGERVNGPALVEVSRLNVLRFDYRLGVSVAYLQGPDLTLPFIPFTPGKPTYEPAVSTATIAAINQTRGGSLKDLAEKLVGIDSTVVYERGIVEGYAGGANGAIQAIRSLATHADIVLRKDGDEKEVLDSIPVVQSKIASALNTPWPSRDVSDKRASVAGVTAELTTYATGNDKEENLRKALLTYAGQIADRVDSIGAASSIAVRYQDAWVNLGEWRWLLQKINDGGAKSFVLQARVGQESHVLFNVESRVELLSHDRFTAPNTAVLRETVVTVVRPSPLTISAGVGMSFDDEIAFGIVPSKSVVPDPVNGGTKTVTVNRIGYTRRSDAQPIPTLLLNYRLWPIQGGRWNVEMSGGAAVDIHGNVGTEVEYVLGAGLSFGHAIVLTGGVHCARVSRLAGDFHPYDQVPDNLTAPPLRKTWKGSPMLAVTIRMR
ncbi:MAG: hypothetical protein HYR74_13085 [Candidatus Eisenbacteria bacterium]|nr:hypothetical protein [Candidatus Eisenbacteria bacterium]